MAVQRVSPSPIVYAAPMAHHRPGTMTGLGIMSIVLAVLGIPVSALMGLVAESYSVVVNETLTPSATWLPPSAPLSPVQIAAVQTKLNALMPGQLNAAQTAALVAYLKSPAQALFYPANDDTLAWQTQSLGTVRNTQAEVTTQRGKLILPISGGATAQLATIAYATSGPTRTIKPIPTAATVAAVISAALYVLLMCAGVATLRGSPRGRTWHHLYAAMKIPLAIGTAVLWGMPSWEHWLGPLGALPALLGLAYAITVLAVLRQSTE